MFYGVVVISLYGRGRLLPLEGETRVIFQEILVALIIKNEGYSQHFLCLLPVYQSKQ